MCVDGDTRWQVCGQHPLVASLALVESALAIERRSWHCEVTMGQPNRSPRDAADVRGERCRLSAMHRVVSPATPRRSDITSRRGRIGCKANLKR